MTLEEFAVGINSEEWYRMGQQERLGQLQTLENILAEEYQRPAIRLEVMSALESLMNPGNLGGFCPDTYSIGIRPEYVTLSERDVKKMLVETGLPFGMGDAMNTVIHEGRHAWQHKVVEEDTTGVISERDREALRINTLLYMNPSVNMNNYLYQLMESDARKFAIEIMQRLLEIIEREQNRYESEIARSIRDARNRELDIAILAKRDPELYHYLSVPFFESIRTMCEVGDVMRFVNRDTIHRNTESKD